MYGRPNEYQTQGNYIETRVALFYNRLKSSGTYGAGLRYKAAGTLYDGLWVGADRCSHCESVLV